MLIIREVWQKIIIHKHIYAFVLVTENAGYQQTPFFSQYFQKPSFLVVKSRDCMGKVQLGVFCQYKDRCLNGTINSVADFIKINTFIEMERIIDILQGHGCNTCNVPLSHASGTQKKWCENVSTYSRAELAASVETSAKTTTTGSVINKHF